MVMLFVRLAESGKILNQQHFKKLGDRKGLAIFEFKRFQLRFLGCFHHKTFVVAHGLKKQQERLKPVEIDRAARILIEHFSNQ